MDRKSSSKTAEWARSHDLSAFAETLDVHVFTALSQGLGLGELKPVVEKRQQPAMAVSASNAFQSRPSAEIVVNKVAQASRTRFGKQKRARSNDMPAPTDGSGPRVGLERRLMAWAVDFLFVTSSLAVALTLATVIAKAKAGDGTSLLELRPVTWLASYAPYQILIGVYGVYLVYGLFFKLFVGRTFGESVMGLRARAFSWLRTA